jgi:hypothetical protein
MQQLTIKQAAQYNDCKLMCLGVVNGSLPSFLHAYFRTQGANVTIEPYRIRKNISFTRLKRYVQENITNNFEAWYQANKFSYSLCEVIANMVNRDENRTQVFTT